MKKSRLLSYLDTAGLCIALPAAVWCMGVLHFLVFRQNTVLTAAAGSVMILLWLAGFFFRRGVIVLLLAETAMMIWFISLTPERCFAGTRWQTPWKRRPSAVIQGDRHILFKDIRDFRYRSEDDYTVCYLDRKYDLDNLESVDLAVSYWDNMEAVAHTMLAFNFSCGRPLVLSLETRLPSGAEQSALGGLFKQYEIIPVLGTPEDIFDLRIKHRGEDFYRYRTRATREQARKLLTVIAKGLNRTPEFYNTLTHNCSTSLSPLFEVLGMAPVDDIRLLINGFSDRMMYDLGYLAHRRGETFASLKSRSYIPGRSRGSGDPE